MAHHSHFGTFMMNEEGGKVSKSILQLSIEMKELNIHYSCHLNIQRFSKIKKCFELVELFNKIQFSSQALIQIRIILKRSIIIKIVIIINQPVSSHTSISHKKIF